MKHPAPASALTIAIPGLGTSAPAPDVPWDHSNAAARFEQGVTAGFEARLAGRGLDRNVTFPDPVAVAVVSRATGPGIL